MSDEIDGFGIGEALALKLFPDYLAFPMRLYFGDDAKMTRQGWLDSFNEMMEKPTGVDKKIWHEQFQEKSVKRED